MVVPYRLMIFAAVTALLSGAAPALPGGAVPAEAQLPTKPAGKATTPASGAVGEFDPSQTTVVTAAPMVRELMCRGGPAAFETSVTAKPSPRYEGYVEMRLSYRRSTTQPGPDWLALEPGTCSWNDSTAPPEPGHVLIDTDADAQPQQEQMLHGSAEPRDTSVTAAEWHPDTLSIPRYLTDSRHYWVFYVYDEGEQVAISHGPWKPSLTEQIAGRGLDATPPPTSREAPAPTGTRRVDDGPLPTSREAPDPLGTSRIGEGQPPPPTTTDITSRWRIRDVSVTPALEGVAIRFKAGPDAATTVVAADPGGTMDTSPTVVISQERPIREPSTGKWFFENPLPLQVGSSREGSGWRYAAASGSPLKRAMRYHYLIDVGGDASVVPAQQHVGEFTTLKQTVQVVFTRIYLLSDGDDDSAGEMTFLFRAEDTEDYLPKRGTVDWESSSRHGINKVLQIDNAPDRLRLLVAGAENDTDLLGSTLFGLRGYDAAVPGRNEDWEWNVAKREFDLSRMPGKSASTCFTMRSMVPRNGTTVAFDVDGCVEVTRQ